MRRFVRRLMLMLVFVLLGVAIVPVFAQATRTTYEEGIQVYRYASTGLVVFLEAKKYVNGNTSRTMITLGTPNCFGYADLPGDPDELEVSNDLGWGGLNTPRLLFRDAPGWQNCDAEIHVSFYAMGGVQWNGTHYTRSARIRGTITLYQGANRTVITFGQPSTSGYSDYGLIFSERAPFPD